jgi:hypothetical protein
MGKRDAQCRPQSVVPCLSLADPVHAGMALVNGALTPVEPLLASYSIAGEILLELAPGSKLDDSTKIVLAAAQCRVNGLQVADPDTAIAWLNAGAAALVVPPKAVKALAAAGVPAGRLYCAVDVGDAQEWEETVGPLCDAVTGFVATLVGGEARWGHATGRREDPASPMGHLERMRDIKNRPHTPETLVREVALALVEGAAAGKHLTVCVPGYALEEADIRAWDAAGVQTGLAAEAIEGGSMPLGRAITAVAVTDRPDGLFTTCVTDEYGVALGVCYSNAESVEEAVRSARGAYWSRKRGLWIKGLTSGHTQELLQASPLPPCGLQHTTLSPADSDTAGGAAPPPRACVGWQPPVNLPPPRR